MYNNTLVSWYCRYQDYSDDITSMSMICSASRHWSPHTRLFLTSGSSCTALCCSIAFSLGLRSSGCRISLLLLCGFIFIAPILAGFDSRFAKHCLRQFGPTGPIPEIFCFISEDIITHFSVVVFNEHTCSFCTGTSSTGSILYFCKTYSKAIYVLGTLAPIRFVYSIYLFCETQLAIGHYRWLLSSCLHASFLVIADVYFFS